MRKIFVGNLSFAAGGSWMKRSKALLASISLGVLVLAAPFAKADTVLGGSFAGNNVIPLGRSCSSPHMGCSSFSQPGGRYQQIYSSTDFSGPVTITRIAFGTSVTSGDPGTAT